MTYPVLSDLKGWLNISGSGSDAELEDILNGCITWAETYCGRQFVIAGDTTVNFPCDDRYINEAGRVLALRGNELVSVTSITLPDTSVIPDTDYYLAPVGNPPYASIRIKQGSSYRFAGSLLADIAVVGKFGYSENCPDDLFLALIQRSQFLWTVKKSGGGGSNSQTGAGGKIITQPARLDPEIMRVFDGYRR